ncbi:MAG: hypothetical protein ACREF3_01895 [Acetobacteraceae bacterium]
MKGGDRDGEGFRLAFAQRAFFAVQCSSLMSSMMMRRCWRAAWTMWSMTAFVSVVFPVPVPPTTRML